MTQPLTDPSTGQSFAEVVEIIRTAKQVIEILRNLPSGCNCRTTGATISPRE